MGYILVNEKNCGKVSFNINNFKIIVEFVNNIIRVLNLNCVWLLQKRKVYIKNYNNFINIVKKN